MKNIYCIICGQYRKFKNIIQHTSHITLVLSIICSKCDNEDEKIFENEKSTETLKILGLTENIYFENMAEENIIQKFRLNNIDKIKNYFVIEIQRNELMSNKNKRVCTTLYHIEHFVILASLVIERI